MFEERTAAEKGFAALWDKEIEPSLAPYRDAYHKRLRLFYIGIPVSIIVSYLVSQFIIGAMASDDPTAPIVIGVILCLLMIYGFGYPFMKVQGSFDGFMERVVSDHFGDILQPDDNGQSAEQIVEKLRELDLIIKGNDKLSNHYHGHYRDCDLRIFNITVDDGHGRHSDSESYFCLDISVPMAFEGEVAIRADYGRVVNFLRSIFSDRKQIKFNHRAFEKRFEVYAENDALARHLITPAFCDNLLSIADLFPRRNWLLNHSLVAGFYDGRFLLVAKGNGDIFALSASEMSPKGIEKGARKLIARMNIVPSIIDHLHGER